jgi:hypothetical protein
VIDILKIISAKDAAFLEKLSASVSSRSRNHIARSPEAVYPLKPQLAEYTTEILPGWWLGTNIANREKMRIIRKACEAAKLTFGKDVVIALPNAN